MNENLLKTSVYAWKGLSVEGVFLRGECLAMNPYQVTSQLLNFNIQPIRISKRFLARQPKKILKPLLQIQMTEQLANLIESGIPMLRALSIIKNVCTQCRVKTLFYFIQGHVAIGKTFGETLEYFPHEFNHIYRQLIRIGENSSQFEKVLFRIAMLEKKKYLLTQKIQKASFYPLLVLSLAIIVSGFLIYEIVPKFQAIFLQAQVKLPWLTELLLQASRFFINRGWLIIILLTIFSFAFKSYLKNSQGIQRLMLGWVFKMPYLGKIVKAFFQMHFCYALALFLQVGVSMLKAFEILIQHPSNIWQKDLFEKALASVQQGKALSHALMEDRFFDNALIEVLQIGEETGLVPESLLKTAGSYEFMLDQFLETLSIWIEPMLMVIVGLIIGLFVVALYLPLFNLGSVIQ